MGEKKADIFKSLFSKGDSLNRLCRSTVISYPSRIESSQLSYGVHRPTSFEILFDLWPDLCQREVLSVSIIVCYQHLNIYGSRALLQMFRNKLWAIEL